MYKPTLKEVKEFADGYKTVPVYCEMYSDCITPVEVLRRLKKVSSQCFILESAEDKHKSGRYTFLGYDPKMEINSENSTPERIKQVISENKSPHIKGLPPFCGGLVGWFAYDFIKYSEPGLKFNPSDDMSFKSYDLMLFDKTIVFDNLRQKIILITTVKTDCTANEYKDAVGRLDEMCGIITNGESENTPPLEILSPFRELFGKERYCEMVESVKKYIYDGDIFQAVLSNRLEADAQGSLLDAYRILRSINPSPYMFYFGSNDIEIAGASPETLVKLNEGTLYTYPLAGTRPCGRPGEDIEQIERELLADEKELAEHNMLVDLGRNDLGKISKFGTVNVENYMNVVRFSHVMHISSLVTGKIRNDKDFADAVAAVLPAGTLSGAPKIRACEIINELEGESRGIYGGALGYISLTGDMDVCISIRLAWKKNGKVYVRSGAGIVADSVPEKEYEECVNKARAVIYALNEAKGGLK